MSRNHVWIGGRNVEGGSLKAGEPFLVGGTAFKLVRGAGDDTTLVLRRSREQLVLHRSTRELVDMAGVVIARFSPDEFAAVELLASVEPEAASHADLGRAIWEGIGFDQYQIHRLMQRVRQRLGDHAGLLENVRGAGYRLTAPVEIR
jgi:DNA-binding response OmpR family regulator